MSTATVEDVAAAQAVVLLNLANGRTPDPELVKIAGVAGLVTEKMAQGPDYKPSAVARLFSPRKVAKRLAESRSAAYDALEEPMRQALASAAAAREETKKAEYEVPTFHGLPTGTRVEVNPDDGELLLVTERPLRDADSIIEAVRSTEKGSALGKGLTLIPLKDWDHGHESGDVTIPAEMVPSLLGLLSLVQSSVRPAR